MVSKVIIHQNIDKYLQIIDIQLKDKFEIAWPFIAYVISTTIDVFVEDISLNVMRGEMST